MVEEIAQRIEAGLVETTGKKIQELYYKVAEKVLTHKQTKLENIQPNKKNKEKKWFDNECKKLRQQVRKIGRKKNKYPHNNTNADEYRYKLKEYKKNVAIREIIFGNTNLT